MPWSVPWTLAWIKGCDLSMHTPSGEDSCGPHPHPHMHIHIHTHARTHTRTHACTYTHAHTHARTRTHAHTYARTRARARAYAHTHSHIRTHTHTRTHASTRTHTHTHTHRELHHTCKIFENFTTMQAINTTGFATSKKRKRKQNKKLLPWKKKNTAEDPTSAEAVLLVLVLFETHAIVFGGFSSLAQGKSPFRPFRSTKCWRVLISFWLTLIAWLWRFSNSSSPSWPGISQIFLFLLPFFPYCVCLQFCDFNSRCILRYSRFCNPPPPQKKRRRRRRKEQ